MSTWTDLDLTAIVEQVAATVWGQQKPGLAWSDLTPVEQHSCREAVLPFVVATRDALNAPTTDLFVAPDGNEHPCIWQDRGDRDPRLLMARPHEDAPERRVWDVLAAILPERA